jgi:sec-independent protein translocase protein TatA
MIGNLSGAHLIAILAVVLLLFGASRLPALARSLGRSARILKQEVSGDAADARPDGAATGGGPTGDGAGPAGSEDPRGADPRPER